MYKQCILCSCSNGKNFKSMNDMRSNGDQLLKEKGGLSLSVVKSLVRREKDERSSSEFVGDDETQSLMYTLFKLEEHFPHDKSQCNSELHHSISLPKDLHGAPPGSFTHQIAETIGKISSVYKMAFFWQSLVLELKKLWSDGQPVPRMPLDAAPDLNCCLLHQEIQVINCCIARKKRRKAAKESLDSLLKRASIDNSNHLYSNGDSPDSEMYIKGSAGDNVLRLGADHPSENLTLLETGELVYSPTLQEGPIMTAELIKETEELVLRTGSVGAGCSQLLSDMQAFKAANPGCVLEDFIRWHSPPDWSEDCAASSAEVGEGSSRRGRLSERMQTKEGNLWKELWGAAKPIPAVEQAPIYDEDLAVESIFDALEVIEPSKLFEQLLAVILSVCFVAAELVLPAGSNLSKLFYDCKDYILSIYQDDISKEKLDEICKVYETMEAIVTHPEETLQIMEAPDEKSPLESKNRFKIKLNFIGKDRHPLWKRAPKDPKEEKKSSPKDEKRSSEERSTKIFSNLLDKKVSIFSKKNAKPTTEVPPPPPPSSAPGPFDDSEWTIL
uniref:Rab3GAP catalytic subunit conserved domain-containing protein n=1 Tax=Oryza barthii TaxID=65489 RepID=A0A0D3GRI2_9ORYZ